MYYYCGMVVEKGGREEGKCYTTALNIITPESPLTLFSAQSLPH